MPPFPSLPGAGALILVPASEGKMKPLREHTNEAAPDQPDVALRYVEAVDNETFKIIVKFKPATAIQLLSDAIGFQISVDGIGVASLIVEHENLASLIARPFLLCAGYCDVDNNRVLPMRFSSLDVVEEPTNNACITRTVRKLGQIDVVAAHMKKVVAGPPAHTHSESFHDTSKPASSQQMAMLAPVAQVSERSIKGKAISHSVAFGEPRAVTFPPREPGTHWEAVKNIGRVVWKYRSRSSLEAEKIILRQAAQANASGTVEVSRPAQNVAQDASVIARATDMPLGPTGLGGVAVATVRPTSMGDNEDDSTDADNHETNLVSQQEVVDLTEEED